MRNNRILQPKDYLSLSGHVANEEDATVFTPVDSGIENGKIIVKGMENDEYSIFEIHTANGYTLLPLPIEVSLRYAIDKDSVCDIYTEDVLGLLQNDPRYAFDNGQDLTLSNIPQKNLEHYGISATGTVDYSAVQMLADGESDNAILPFTVINTPGFDLPQTGDQGVWMYGVGGGVLMLAAAMVILFTFKKKDDQHTVQQ